MNAPERILIIDDEPMLRMNLRALLEDMGYEVIDACDGPEGLASCAREHPDLVLMDVRMPGMDGFEVCTRLKADEALARTPVLFLSGMLDAQDKVKAFHCGGVDYITKPFHFEEVEARVRTHLELRRQHLRLEEQNRTLQSSLQQTELLNRKLIEMNERLRQSEELKGHFLSNMRGEINNPLNTILALGTELQRPDMPADRRIQAGRLVAAEAADLDFQLRNIFAAAELEAGEAFPFIAQVDAGSVVRDAMDSLGHAARAKGVTIDLECRSDAFMTDADKLRVLGANLLSNGIKFSREGGRVQVRLREEDGQLILEVEDDGIGISPEDQGLIFERFRQLDTGATRSHQGQGLGLSVVKSLVGLLGGSIAVASEPGHGTLFTCHLPRGEAAEQGSTLALDGNLFFFGEAEEV